LPTPTLLLPTPTPEIFTPTPALTPVHVLASEDALFQQMQTKQREVKIYRYTQIEELLRPMPWIESPEEPMRMPKGFFKIVIEGEVEGDNIHQVIKVGDFKTERIIFNGVIYVKEIGEWTRAGECPPGVCNGGGPVAWIQGIVEINKMGFEHLEHAPVRTVKYQRVIPKEELGKSIVALAEYAIESAKEQARAMGASEEEVEELIESMKIQQQALIRAVSVEQSYFIWIGEDGLIYQIAGTFSAYSEEQGRIVELVRTTIKFYDYNDPSIKIKPPVGVRGGD
jgi:hypothetical protein